MYNLFSLQEHPMLSPYCKFSPMLSPCKLVKLNNSYVSGL